MPRKGQRMPESAKKRISLSLIGNGYGIGNRSHLGRKLSEETKKKISASLIHNSRALGKHPKQNPLKGLHISQAKKGKPLSPEHKQALRDAWARDYENRRNAWVKSTNRKPNIQEQKLIGIIEEFNLPYIYCGNHKVRIFGKDPDFICIDGRKEVIELFGHHWHKESDILSLINHYQRYGFNCIVIWDSQLSDIPLVLSLLR